MTLEDLVDRVHDAELINDECDGIRPPIGNINAPDGYIELMTKCWNPNPMERPKAEDIWLNKICEIKDNEHKYPTDLGRTSNIGPITISNLGTCTIYKSRPLSDMISSAMTIISLRSQSISLKYGNKS